MQLHLCQADAAACKGAPSLQAARLGSLVVGAAALADVALQHPLGRSSRLCRRCQRDNFGGQAAGRGWLSRLVDQEEPGRGAGVARQPARRRQARGDILSGVEGRGACRCSSRLAAWECGCAGVALQHTKHCTGCDDGILRRHAAGPCGAHLAHRRGADSRLAAAAAKREAEAAGLPAADARGEPGGSTPSRGCAVGENCKAVAAQGQRGAGALVSRAQRQRRAECLLQGAHAAARPTGIWHGAPAAALFGAGARLVHAGAARRAQGAAQVDRGRGARGGEGRRTGRRLALTVAAELQQGAAARRIRRIQCCARALAAGGAERLASQAQTCRQAGQRRLGGRSGLGEAGGSSRGGAGGCCAGRLQVSKHVRAAPSCWRAQAAQRNGGQRLGGRAPGKGRAGGGRAWRGGATWPGRCAGRRRGRGLRRRVHLQHGTWGWVGRQAGSCARGHASLTCPASAPRQACLRGPVGTLPTPPAVLPARPAAGADPPARRGGWAKA